MAMKKRPKRPLKREYSIAKARNQLARIVHQAERGSPIKITRRGEPVAILLATRKYEDLTRSTPSFREAFEKFSRDVDLRALDIDPGFFEKLRDRSPGRKVKF